MYLGGNRRQKALVIRKSKGASDVRWIYDLKFWCFEMWAPLVGLMTLAIGRMD